MRDDSARWDRPAAPGFEAAGLSLTPIRLGRQVMVSGQHVASLYASAVGWPEVATGADYAVSMRRDRVLLVGEVALEPGFHPDHGLAVSNMSDGFAVFDLVGPRALACLNQGAHLDLSQPSRSAVHQVFGIEVLLYRHGVEDAFRSHIPSAHVAAFVSNLGLFGSCI